MKKQKKTVWGARVDKWQGCSSKPLRLIYDVDQKRYETSNNVEQLSVFKTLGITKLFGSVLFCSTNKKEVTTFIAGAAAVGYLLVSFVKGSNE